MKKIISLWLALVMLLGLTIGPDCSALAMEDTGTCGTEVTYAFDAETGVLTIAGTGEMYDYTAISADSPFCGRNNIKTIEVQNDVTGIGANAFIGCEYLTTVTLADSVTTIGENAFSGCTALTSVEIPAGVTVIPSGLFSDCIGLREVALSGNVTEISRYAFFGCEALTDVYYGGEQAQWEAVTVDTDNNPLQTATIHCKEHEHQYTETVKEAADCQHEGVMLHHCDGCGDEYETVIPIGDHHYVEVMNNATCTEAGISVKQCTVCNKAYIDDVPAKGHDYIATITEATCTAEGEAVYTCSVCGDTYTETLPITDHTPAETPVIENEVPATCHATGSCEEVIYCTQCGIELSREEKEIAQLEHIPGDAATENEIPATCDAPGAYDEVVRCTLCNDVLSSESYVIPQLVHIPGEIVTEKEVASTCSSLGSYELAVYCTLCGKELSREKKIIPLASHTVVTDDAIAPSCVKHGYTKGSHCAVCGKILVAQQVVSATGHQYQQTVKAANCRDMGFTTYTCSVCGDSYRDNYTAVTTNHVYSSAVTRLPSCTLEGERTYTCSVCGNQYTESIPKDAHVLDAPVIENKTDATCSAEGAFDEVVYCSVCHREQSRTHKTVAKLNHTPAVDDAVPATCTRAGLTRGSHCAVCGKVITSQITIPATGHQYIAAIKEPTCSDRGYTTFTCSVCGNMYQDHFTERTNQHSYSAAVTTQPTCTQEGIKTYTCSVCGKAYTETIAKLSHTPDAPVKENEIPATCTAAGSYDEVVYCSGCHTECSRSTKQIAKLAHTPAVKEAVAPTCTATGLTEGSVCAECGTILTPQTTVPALGHDFSNNAEFCRRGCGAANPDYLPPETEHHYVCVVIQEADCTHTGMYRYVCSGCGDTYITTTGYKHTVVTDEAVAPTCDKSGLAEGSHCEICGKIIKAQVVVPATGHTKETTKSSVAATCTKAGSETEIESCKVCGKEFSKITKILPATGHQWDSGTVTAPATTEADGEMTYSCTVCGETRTEVIPRILINGWKQENGSWYYYTDNVPATGWKKVGGKWYFFDKEAIMQTGWLKDGNKWYYFEASGAMLTGWQSINNKWYYFNAGGDMTTGWKKINDRWYYFTVNGDMVTGWKKISNKWYYFNNTGTMRTAALKQNGKTYTFDKNGACTNP